MRTKIKDILNSESLDYTANIKGWVRSFRNNQFIALNDGSTIHNIQIVINPEQVDETVLKNIQTGASMNINGKVIASQGKGQRVEIVAENIEVLGTCNPEEFPLQAKNRPSLEYLREIAHLRFRTNVFGAVFRVRHSIAYAIHKFFNDKGFVYLHTPIVTASDAEGAGEMFRVTTLPFDNPPRLENGEIDFTEDFFGKSTNLTVSGQLEAELAAMSFGEVYTFGPTFRAENSNTTRHLAEFWMVEPEVAFNDLKDNMDLAEAFMQYVIRYVLEHNMDDLQFLDERLANEEKQKPANERSEMSLLDKLNFVINNQFERITYTEAIDILLQSKPYQKKQFKYDVSWGIDLQSEHERFLVEKHFKKPVIVTDYPKDIKAFYMRLNDDGKTVAAMDILAPGIGEIVGGSQREERLELLEQRMAEMHIPSEEMYWYLDSRRFGTAPHAGFGLGFERMVLFITGMTNIRDVIPFPRTPKNAAF